MSNNFDNPSAESSCDDEPHRLFLSASGTVVSAPSSTVDDDGCAKNEEKKSIFDSDEEEESDSDSDDEAVNFPVVQMMYDVRNKMKDLRDQLGLENPKARISLDGQLSKLREKRIGVSEHGDPRASVLAKHDKTNVSISEYCAIVKIAMLENIIEWADAQMAYVLSAHGDDVRTKACTHVCIELMQRWELISCVRGEDEAKEDEIGQLTAYFPLLSTKENTDPEKAWKFMMRYQTSEDKRYTICYASMIQNIETDWLTPVVPRSAYSSEEERLALEIKPKFWSPVFSGHMWSPYQLYHAGDKMWRNFDLKPNAPIYRQFKPINSCIFDAFTLSLLGYGSMQAHKDTKYNFPVGTHVVHRKVVPNIADGRQVIKQLIQALVERRLEDAIDENEGLKEDMRHTEPEHERPNNVALFDAIDTKGNDASAETTAELEDVKDEEFRRKVAKSDRHVEKLQHLIGRLEESDVPGHINLPPSLISTVYLIPNKTNARQKFVRAVMEIVSHTMLTRQQYSLTPNVDDLSEKMNSSTIAGDDDSSSSAVAASSGEVNPFSAAANCEDD